MVSFFYSIVLFLLCPKDRPISPNGGGVCADVGGGLNLFPEVWAETTPLIATFSTAVVQTAESEVTIAAAAAVFNVGDVTGVAAATAVEVSAGANYSRLIASLLSPLLQNQDGLDMAVASSTSSPPAAATTSAGANTAVANEGYVGFELIDVFILLLIIMTVTLLVFILFLAISALFQKRRSGYINYSSSSPLTGRRHAREEEVEERVYTPVVCISSTGTTSF